MQRRALLKAGLAGSLAAPALAPGLRAQSGWPNKTVRFVVPFAPGGGTDTVSRLICDQLSRAFGQQFVIDNKGGAGGNIGTVEIARAAPDGYTLGLISVASHTLNPMLYSRLPYDPDKDIVAISRVAILANLLGLTQSVPANNVAELIALCKKSPGKYSFASSGPGTSLHLSGELFKSLAEVDIVHIPFRGAAPMTTELLAGRLDLAFATLPSVISQIESGELHALAVASAKRAARLPDLPTLTEAGVTGVEADAWFALFAPAKTPQPAIDRLYKSATAALSQPSRRPDGHFAMPANEPASGNVAALGRK